MTFLDALFWTGLDLPYIPGHLPWLVPILILGYWLIKKQRRGEIPWASAAALVYRPIPYAVLTAL